ncbi:hypothetical protein DFH08DRAFT_1079173 [Mycena albidolilacea]|uniref:DUF6924 domain-containing protein n=1 Tax=Mycena albidolilacea TaxID=1033008 RepID=A0AAD7A5H8_9AGAR|nr:hypothetical protein DFH08DRAFT_1079173 [Mycena albidolilacea]
MWAVFVTAKPSSRVLKALNRALLLIQDFEYAEYPAGSEWVLLTSAQLPSAAPGPTLLPVTVADFSGGNAFVSMSLAEISAFVDANSDALLKIDVTWAHWVVIDQKGLETSTCLVCKCGSDFDEDEEEEEGGGSTSEFQACRMPYEMALSMVVNLDIANMNFEDFVDEKAGVQEDGVWKWRSFDPSDRGTDDMTAEEIKREKALQELRDGGYAD